MKNNGRQIVFTSIPLDGARCTESVQSLTGISLYKYTSEIRITFLNYIQDNTRSSLSQKARSGDFSPTKKEMRLKKLRYMRPSLIKSVNRIEADRDHLPRWVLAILGRSLQRKLISCSPANTYFYLSYFFHSFFSFFL